MSKERSTGEFICVIDKHGDPQGVDINSSGYPYIATHPSNIRFWRRSETDDVIKYLKVINYGNKGYQLRYININMDM